jgi:hypothetical protein
VRKPGQLVTGLVRYADLAPDAHDKVVQSWARRDAPVAHERRKGGPKIVRLCWWAVLDPLVTGQFFQALGDQRGGLSNITAALRDPRAQEGEL